MTLTTGTVVALLLITTGLLLSPLAVWMFRKGRRCDEYDQALMYVGGGCVTLVAFLMVLLPLIGLGRVGFDPDYLGYHDVTGRVQQLATPSIISTRYVAVIDGEAYKIDDSRAALLRPGDTVLLNCVKEPDWGSSDNAWACKWGGRK